MVEATAFSQNYSSAHFLRKLLFGEQPGCCVPTTMFDTPSHVLCGVMTGMVQWSHFLGGQNFRLSLRLVQGKQFAVSNGEITRL